MSEALVGNERQAALAPAALLAGYRRFRRERYPEHAALYERLESGQSPRIMIIACADSRVDPAAIFSARPGELFIVRNVANLVPPCDPITGHHGTSAAIEFAVGDLGVEHIVVMGHGRCGGIAACLSGYRPDGFIGRWVSIAAPARDRVLAELTNAPVDEQRLALELASVRASLANLGTFPVVAARVQAGRLALHGAWFSIFSGKLHWMDPATGQFAPVPA